MRVCGCDPPVFFEMSCSGVGSTPEHAITLVFFALLPGTHITDHFSIWDYAASLISTRLQIAYVLH